MKVSDLIKAVEFADGQIEESLSKLIIKSMPEFALRKSIGDFIDNRLNDLSGKVKDSEKEQLNELIENFGKEIFIEVLMDAILNDLYSDACGLNPKSMKHQRNELVSVITAIEFSQSENYNPTLTDLMTPIHMLIFETLMTIPESQLNMYKNAPLEVPLQISQNMAEDIMDTWRKTLKQEPDQSLVIFALATALINEINTYTKQREKAGKDTVLPSAEYLFDVVGFTEDEEEQE